MLPRLRSDPASLLTVQRFVALFALSLLLVPLLFPPSYWVQALGWLTGFQALFSAGVAVSLRHPYNGPSLNRWDQAAAFLLVHFALKAMV